MSKICQVTGKKPRFGKQLSHSHRRSSRRWDPNIQTKRYYLPSEKRWIKHRRHRLHLRDHQEQDQHPPPDRAQEVRPGDPQACGLQGGALGRQRSHRLELRDHRCRSL
ncbi:MAG: 50S ribosomal protein L28 [Acidimicrobiaceae bacterium]|nr:50S ribosomal protein L28 [Acidimicrobiaceae bacterium]